MEASTRQRGSIVGAGSPWWLFLVTGIAWLLISVIVLRFDVTSVATVGALIGVILLIAGANEFVAMGVVQSWKWLHGLMGVLFVVGGIWAFVHPIGAFYELAAIIGFLLVLKGGFDIIVATVAKEINELWWLALVVGILEVLLGFWASQQFVPARAALIIVWVGFMALFRGIGEITLAFRVRSASR